MSNVRNEENLFLQHDLDGAHILPLVTPAPSRNETCHCPAPTAFSERQEPVIFTDSSACIYTCVHFSGKRVVSIYHMKKATIKYYGVPLNTLT